VLIAALAFPGLASAQSSGSATAGGSGGGGAVYVPPPPPAKRAKIVNGQAIPPVGAPTAVVNAIAAANAITAKPYIYGGGHKAYTKASKSALTPALEKGYDCSGSVSMALYGARLLKSPLDSSSFMKWGLAGKGQWITVYTNPGHAYVVIAGLRFDTSRGDRVTPQEAASGSGPRWRKYNRKPAGFTARHPKNL
jgi:hypothetical protein